MSIVIVVLGAYIVDRVGKPLPVAAAVAVISAVFNAIGGSDAQHVAVVFFSTLAYMAVFYSLVDRFADDLFIWCAIVVCGGLLWFLLPFWLA